MMKHILCYSGGKDSTAMLIHILSNNLPLDEIIYVDVGEWMWDITEHIKQVETELEVHITILDASSEIEQGFQKWGFPHFMNRWCTGIKRDTMKQYIQQNYHSEEIIQYVGYCADEERRTSKKLYSSYDTEYPLVKAGITTDDAMELCVSYGFDFGGIYQHHSHYTCWMCPLQRVQELEYIYIHRPDLFAKLCELQTRTSGWYHSRKTVFEWGQRFWKEQQQNNFENMMKKRKESKREGEEE